MSRRKDRQERRDSRRNPGPGGSCERIRTLDPGAEQELLGKIQRLPPDQVAEVEAFVDFLHQRNDDRGLRDAFTRLSERAFAKAWNNPADAAYDRL